MVRRLVLAALVLVALALLTVSFRSPTSGALHDLQGAGASALRPFQVAADRVARPFQDVYDYFSGLANAKSENAKLKRELREANAQLNANVVAAARAQELEKLLRFEQGNTFPKDYRPVNTSVISYPTGSFAKEVTIAAGSSDGVRLNTPVVTADGLIGHVTNTSPHTALVTLITDPDSNVPSVDVTQHVSGLIRQGQGSSLIFDRVPKADSIRRGEIIVTRGTVDRRYPDIYPYGIPVGRVESVGESDIESYLTVQVTPFAQLDHLDAVAALVPIKKR